MHMENRSYEGLENKMWMDEVKFITTAKKTNESPYNSDSVSKVNFTSLRWNHDAIDWPVSL